MAIPPVNTPSPLVEALSQRGNTNAPGRPQGPAERMPVPGQPRAEQNRPIISPGRIPVPAPIPTETVEAGNEQLNLIEQIEEQVKSSAEYQALKPFLKEVGLVEEEDEGVSTKPADTGDESVPVAEADTAEPAQADTEVRTAQFTTVEIQINSVTYQRVVVRMEQQREEPPRRSDPLALDLNGDGLKTTGIENGVQFDINADSQLDQVSFVAGGDAFLAIDRNGNGSIDDGSELFGDQNGDANGYDALARYDNNRDGRIDANDTVYNQLRLFTLDALGNQQLTGLNEAGIRSLSLNYSNTETMLNQYDTIAQISSFEREDGSEGKTGDLLLAYRSVN